MKKRQIIDITGTPLTPSRQGKRCLGNGEHKEYECCCDECDYYLKCFPLHRKIFKGFKLQRKTNINIDKSFKIW